MGSATMVFVPRLRTSEDLRVHNETRLLRAIHDGQATATRSLLTRELGMARGTASVLVAELIDARLLAETPAPTASRGRPTRIPGPHPHGPIALTVDLREDGWELAAGELGGVTETLATAGHSGSPQRVFAELANTLRHEVELSGGRVVGVGMSVAGPVRDGRLVHVPHLAWDATDVSELLADVGVPVLLGNDATLAALAEARRGALRGIGTGIHLYVDFDVGGSLVVDGRPLGGATGIAGEFGHMRLTGGTAPCMCGARGCWGLEIGANTLLRALGEQAGYGRGRAQAERLLEQAITGRSPQAAQALRANASALGAGLGALVNANDPELITLSGFGVAIHDFAPELVRQSYLEALMTFHRDAPPAIVATRLGRRGPILGAMELVFDEFLTPDAVRAWIDAHRGDG